MLVATSHLFKISSHLIGLGQCLIAGWLLCQTAPALADLNVAHQLFCNLMPELERI
jgi:hypothetical protein